MVGGGRGNGCMLVSGHFFGRLQDSNLITDRQHKNQFVFGAMASEGSASVGYFPQPKILLDTLNNCILNVACIVFPFSVM